MTEQPRLFLSYVSADRDRVAASEDVLAAVGLPVWFDRRSIPGCAGQTGARAPQMPPA